MQRGADGENEGEHLETIERPPQVGCDQCFPLRPVERSVPPISVACTEFAHAFLPDLWPPVRRAWIVSQEQNRSQRVEMSALCQKRTLLPRQSGFAHITARATCLNYQRPQPALCAQQVASQDHPCR